MRQKDIALIVAIVFVSAIISFLVSGKLFASPKNRQQQAEVVEPINADLPEVDVRFFNRNTFDPTQLITISENSNPNPFSSSTR